MGYHQRRVESDEGIVTRKNAGASALLALVFAAGACERPAKDYTVLMGESEVASGPARMLDITWTEVQTYSPTDLGLNEFGGLTAGTVAAAPDGSVVVLDRMGGVLGEFPAGSGHGRILANVGEGPAELRRPIAVGYDPDGFPTTYDLARQQLRSFGPAGAPNVRSLTLPQPGGALLLQRKTLWLVGYDFAGTKWVFSRSKGEDFEPIVTLGEGSEGPRPIEVCGLELPMRMPLARRLIASGGESGGAYTASVEYDVSVLSGDGDALRFTRPISPRAPSLEDAVKVLGEEVPFPPNPTCTLRTSDIVEARGLPEAIQVVDRVFVDACERVWVTVSQAYGGTTDVISIDGRYLGTMEALPGVPVGGFSNGDLLLVSETRLGAQGLRRLRPDGLPGLECR